MSQRKEFMDATCLDKDEQEPTPEQRILGVINAINHLVGELERIHGCEDLSEKVDEIDNAVQAFNSLNNEDLWYSVRNYANNMIERSDSDKIIEKLANLKEGTNYRFSEDVFQGKLKIIFDDLFKSFQQNLNKDSIEMICSMKDDASNGDHDSETSHTLLKDSIDSLKLAIRFLEIILQKND